MSYPEGIDVSLYQSQQYAANALKGKSLFIVKVSQRDFVDPKLALHTATARAMQPDFFGGYHWLDPQPRAEDQAALYLRNAPDDLDFHAVDVEGAILRIGEHYAYARDLARRFIAYIKKRDDRPVLQYSSRGTWPGNNGQDGNWVADYGGDPNRLSVRVKRSGVPWVIWQWTSTSGVLDRNYYQADKLAKLCGAITPAPPVTPPAGGHKVQFIQISASDADKLPSLVLAQPTPIETLDGEQWKMIGPTTVHVLPGLPDAHSNRRLVVVRTGRFYADSIQRPTVQVAVLPVT